MVGFSNTSDPRKAKSFLLRLIQLCRDKEVRGEPCRDNTKGLNSALGSAFSRAAEWFVLVKQGREELGFRAALPFL